LLGGAVPVVSYACRLRPANAKFRVCQRQIVLCKLLILNADLIVTGDCRQLKTFLRTPAIVRRLGQRIGHNRTLSTFAIFTPQFTVANCGNNQFDPRCPQGGMPNAAWFSEILIYCAAQHKLTEEWRDLAHVTAAIRRLSHDHEF
jgi:hypothetical protein